MSSTQQLIEQFLAKGGKINKIPAQNYKRAEFEAPVLKTRRIIADLKERASKTAAEG